MNNEAEFPQKITFRASNVNIVFAIDKSKLIISIFQGVRSFFLFCLPIFLSLTSLLICQP
jgi:hypothetical protein